MKEWKDISRVKLIEVGFLPSKNEGCVICFFESPLKLMKNAYILS